MICATTISSRGQAPIDAQGSSIEKRALAEKNVGQVELPELFAMLQSGDAGLSSPAALATLNRVGRNDIETAGRSHLLANLFARFRNPLVLVLLGAAGVSAATGDIASFVIITTIILISVVLDVVQERRAEDAAARLRAQVSLSTKVLRDGQVVGIPTAEIVPGDVVILSAGDLVPADCRLIEARDLYVNEALLSGEPYPAEKNAARSAAGATESAFAPNLIFMGSSVVSGTAKALVYAIGRTAQLGSIAHSLQKEPPPTAFAIGIRDFGLMIVRLTSLLVLFVLLANLLFHRPLLESFLFALALAVGLTPELLPMVVSVTLAHGAIRLSRKQVIVKRLSAIHDLGSMDVLCSDKTGTLTEARIELVRAIDIAGNESCSALSKAQLNAAYETGLKSPLDDAILAAGPCDLASWRKIDEVPFDFERRRVSILLEGEGKRLLIVKGAPEDILRLASHFEAGDTTKAFDNESRGAADATLNALGADGYRALGVAWREVEADREHVSLKDEVGLTFCGFVVFLDPPKQGAREALAELATLGVAVKVISGDNEQVTRHVCRELDLDNITVLTGSEITTLTDEALQVRVERTALFCRITPPQKSRIVAALRRGGHVVGYIGDGINDAPPLHVADIGFSVDTAVDVAKEAACMILLRKDLSVLAEGVREGRRTFANILKYVMMGTSSNFGNMFSMAGGVLFLPFLPMLPIQILLNNLLYDLSETAIPMDRVEDTMIARPRRWDLSIVRHFMYVLGPLSSIFDFMTFGLLRLFGAGEALFHTAWFVQSLATQVLVIFIIRAARPFRTPPHPLLIASSLSAIGIALVLPYSPFASWLGFVPIPLSLLAALAGIVAVYLFAVHIAKNWVFARHELA